MLNNQPQPQPEPRPEEPLKEALPPLPEETGQEPIAPGRPEATQPSFSQEEKGQGPPMTPPARPEEPPAEKKEFFRREEVRTMQKDLSRLQEEEALKERERLSKIKTEEELKKERERIERLRKEEEERIFAKSAILEQERAKLRTERVEKQVVAEKSAPSRPPEKKEWPKPDYKLPLALPKRPSVFEKFLARGLVIVMLIAFWGVFITFWYWFLVVRKGETPPTTPPTEEPTPRLSPPLEITPEPTIEPTPVPSPAPAALIQTEAQNILEFSSAEELPALFRETVRQFGEENTFSEIIFYNSAQNNYLSLPELLSVFQINAPPNVIAQLPPLPEGFTAFIYSSKIANRFGFVSRITEQERLNQAMLAWEPTMEQDMANLFALLDKREPAESNKFRRATYQGAVFRYLSFPSINFGIVWTILPITNIETGQTEYYFVFTTSGESMMRVIDKLQKGAGFEL